MCFEFHFSLLYENKTREISVITMVTWTKQILLQERYYIYIIRKLISEKFSEYVLYKQHELYFIKTSVSDV